MNRSEGKGWMAHPVAVWPRRERLRDAHVYCVDLCLRGFTQSGSSHEKDGDRAFKFQKWLAKRLPIIARSPGQF